MSFVRCSIYDIDTYLHCSVREVSQRSASRCKVDASRPESDHASFNSTISQR